MWGAGHLAELPYIWPSYDLGTPVALLFGASERRLAREMVQYWGALVRDGRPRVDGQARWPRYDEHHESFRLHTGDTSDIVDDAAFAAEHRCRFWSTMPFIALFA